jgi:phosphatidylglycerol:prolipoprotein diacylglycerol transferase
MHRVLFEWRGIVIHAYPAMLYVGLVGGVVAGNYAAHRAGLDPARAYVATLLLIVPALLGARLLFVATHWHVYRRDLRRIWRRSDGGAALYGGLALAVPLSVPLLAALRVSFGAFWDVAIFTMLVGMVFTKVGCLLNGCCAGRPTTGLLGLRLPDTRGEWRRRIPTQLLEAGLAVVLIVGAAVVWKRLPFEGALFLCVVGAYGIGRTLLESTRDTVDRVGSLGVNYAISGVLVVLSSSILLFVWLSAVSTP